MRAPWLFGFSPVMCTFQRVNSKKKIAAAEVKIQFKTAGLLCGGVSRRIDVLIAKVNAGISQAHEGNCRKKSVFLCKSSCLMAVLHQIKPGYLEVFQL